MPVLSSTIYSKDMKMKRYLLSLLFALSLLSAGEITIAVAANVSYAIDELKSEFSKDHPDTRVQVILGSSGKLTAQIRNGAPYGLFMSANLAYPEALYQDGLATMKPSLYARGALAFLSVKKLDFSKGIKVLTSDKITKIAIANPKTAPYGKAAEEAIKKSGLYEKVKDKFVFGESISQTVSYAVTAADIGLIAASSLYSPHMKQYKKGIHWALVDPSLYTPIKQGIVLLKKGAGNPEYRVFYDFILSPEAQKIFKKYGYLE